MEKKPIKRNPHIVKLSQDHHASLLFCWKLRQGVKKEVAPDRMGKYIAYFYEYHFTPHFFEEETILFAPMPEDELVLQAFAEHKTILNLAHTLIDGKAENPYEEINRLADLVDKHVRFEERVLFPHIEHSLDESQLEAIGEQLSDQPEKDDYADTFWK